MSAGDAGSSGLGEGELPAWSESIELVKRARKGDQSALEQLMRRYQDRLLRIVRVRLGAGLREHLESMDIVQNTLEVAIQKIHRLDPRTPASILQWLARIAEHQIHDAHDYLYAAKRDPNRRVPLDPGDSSRDGGLGESLRDGASLPEERAWQTEIREVVDHCVTHLPLEYREVILLRDYCCDSWESISGQLDRTAGATRELHRRAWIKLRRAVREKINGPF
jgi:RNA polymerase sigma-70 factor (ECF subfamily)